MKSISFKFSLPHPGFLWVLGMVIIAPGLAKTVENIRALLTAETRAAIRKVIEAQMEAFRQDDGETAFSYAASDVQNQFGTPENFMRMVRLGYRPLYRPLQIHFKLAHMEEGKIWQPLLATAEDGHIVIAIYFVTRLPNGDWRIGGVMLMPTGQIGT